MALAAESAGDPEFLPGTAGGGFRSFARSFASVLAALGVVTIAASTALAAPPPTPCTAPKELTRFTAPLTNLVKTLRSGQQIIKVVALGSSSTAGSGASNPNASYPARLDAELDRRFPGRDFQVVNLGVGGQLAERMFERIASDVLPHEPTLVLWQTGVNDAIHDVGLESFRNTLKAGIEKLRGQGVDVILVNMQFYPRSERIAGYTEYNNVMREVAESEETPIFRRFSIMKHFIKSGQFTAAQLLSPDLFHMNDLSYGCLAGLLADAIEEQVAPFAGSQDTARGAQTAPRR